MASLAVAARALPQEVRTPGALLAQSLVIQGDQTAPGLPQSPLVVQPLLAHQVAALTMTLRSRPPQGPPQQVKSPQGPPLNSP